MADQKIKYIHRTLTYWTGVEIIADFEKMEFKQIKRTWHDELEIPRGRVQNLEKHTVSYRMSLDYFIEHAEIEE